MYEERADLLVRTPALSHPGLIRMEVPAELSADFVGRLLSNEYQLIIELVVIMKMSTLLYSVSVCAFIQYVK